MIMILLQDGDTKCTGQAIVGPHWTWCSYVVFCDHTNSEKVNKLVSD